MDGIKRGDRVKFLSPLTNEPYPKVYHVTKTEPPYFTIYRDGEHRRTAFRVKTTKFIQIIKIT